MILKNVQIFTDGACSPNPGAGGFGTILRYTKANGEVIEKEISGGYKNTTNNRMELMAVIAGVEALSIPCNITITTDSKYVSDAFNKEWIKGWQIKRFKGVKNPDLWIRLIKALEKHTYQFVWVKGHAGHPENERCDYLAVMASNNANCLASDEEYEKIS